MGPGPQRGRARRRAPGTVDVPGATWSRHCPPGASWASASSWSGSGCGGYGSPCSAATADPGVPGSDTFDGRAAFAGGALHGLAGSLDLLGIPPALALLSDEVASSYLLCFGTGSVVAMETFASLIGWIAGRPGASGAGTQRALLGLCSLIAVAVGGFWVLSSLPA